MGDKIFFPNSTQFDKMNEHLEMIAKAVGSQVDLSTWAGVQKAVRMGIAPDLIPIGTQLVVHHDVYGDMLYDVVAHNYFKSVHDDKAHTMTLMSHDLLPIIQFDAPEALYYAETELPAGTYNFTIPKDMSEEWVQGTYNFTLTKPLPKGGILVLNSVFDSNIASDTVDAYENPNEPTAIESCIIYFGSVGQKLGDFGVELNDFNRVAYGNNNYKESAIRQFLNSSAEAGKVWTPQTRLDLRPRWSRSLAGFMRGLNNDFVSVVGEVIVPCSANNVYEAPDSTVVKGSTYTVHDKFYLASQKEIFDISSNVIDDGSVMFPFYNGATNADRIKYKDGVAEYYYTRSASSQFSDVVRVVTRNGNSSTYNARFEAGCTPLCTIV